MPLTVASWNVLAQAYVRPDIYRSCDPAALEPAARKARIVERAWALPADVLCLQEVEESLHDALVERFVDSHVCLFGRKGNDKPDGCATLVRMEHVLPVPGGGQNFADGSGHLFTWQFAEMNGRQVGIATTHLKWDKPRTPSAARHGVRQAAELLEMLSRIEPEAGWVVCGDFNVEAKDEVLDLFRRAGFTDPHEAAGPTCSANGHCRRIDFVLCGPKLSGLACAWPAALEGTVLPSVEMPSDHVPLGARIDWAD